MRLICPHCMSGVTVPDDAAGKDATCPNCGKSFPTPARYSAAVVAEQPAAPPPVPSAPEVAPMPSTVPPAPPPGYVPPAPPVPPPAATGTGFLPPAVGAQGEIPVPAGYTRSIGITLSPHVFTWLPAVLLLLVLVFTCFPWVGSYVGGTAVYSQRPWNAAYGGLTSNPALAQVVKIPTEWRDKLRSDWELMVFYLLFLIFAVALAWADRALGDVPPKQVPPLVKVWPHRHAVILVLASVTLLFSLIQVLNGFGMERAIRQYVTEQHAAERQQAGESDAKRADVDYKMDLDYAKYNLERTTWVYLALLCNLLAVLAMVVRFLLARRANKPPPKILLHY